MWRDVAASAAGFAAVAIVFTWPLAVRAGSALTAQEIEQRVKAVGNGSTQDLIHLLNTVRTEHRNKLSGIRAVDPQAFDVYMGRRGVTFDTGAVEHQNRPVR